MSNWDSRMDLRDPLGFLAGWHFFILSMICTFMVQCQTMEFVCEPGSVVASPGQEITLCCTVNKSAKFCNWYWSLAYANQEPRTLKKFAPINSPDFGPGTDCSLVVRTPLTEDNPKELVCEVLSEDRLEGVESRAAVITVSRDKGGNESEELLGLPKGAFIGIGISGLLVILLIVIFAVPSSRSSVLRRVSKRQRNKIDIERNLLAPVTIQAINHRLQNERGRGAQQLTVHQSGRNKKGKAVASPPPWRPQPLEALKVIEFTESSENGVKGKRLNTRPADAPPVAPRPEHTLVPPTQPPPPPPPRDDGIYIQPANVYENLRPGVAPPASEAGPRRERTIYANLRAHLLARRAVSKPPKPPVKPKPRRDAGHVNAGVQLDEGLPEIAEVPSVSREVKPRALSDSTTSKLSGSIRRGPGNAVAKKDATKSVSDGSSAAPAASSSTRWKPKPASASIYEAIKKFEGR